MAYPTNFLRLVASGTLSGTEGFSFGMSLVPGAFQTAPRTVPDTVPQGVIDALAGFAATDLRLNPAANLRTVKVNEIGVDGRYTRDTTVLYDWPAPGPKGAGTTAYPPQVALAVTLRTGVTRGLAASGRFYLPAPSLPFDQNTGLILEADVATFTARLVTMLDQINAAFAGEWRIGVASDVREGAMREATGITVGRVFDTVQTRRRSLRETYPTITPLAAPA